MRFAAILISFPLLAQVYLDPKQPAGKRVEDLLGRMTLEEKIGQLNMPCVYRVELGKTVAEKREACKKFTQGAWRPGLGPGGGFFTLPNNILPDGPRSQAEFHNELQKIALEKTRLKIPLLQTEEGTHGLMCSGGTIFPEGLGIGSTWNLDLVRQIYTATAMEARAIGIHELFTLVVEPNRDPRLGRNEEGYGEDPYLCARIAEAIVEGVQGKDVSAPDRAIAGLCHYPGQSQPASGLERGAMEISERTLREVFLPPWVAGIRGRGALGVMATYPAIDGVPAHASDWILGRILRDELGFQGLVLGEGSGLTTLVYEKVAADQKQAGIDSLRAGVDVGISHEPAYMEELLAAAKEGKIEMKWIDRAVRRILTQKFRLGLFERPYVDVERAAGGLPRDQHRELARKVAQEGIVLLKNEKSLLPLPKDTRTIAVIGPNADNGRDQLGDYTSRTILQHVVTVLEGIRAKMSPGAEVLYVKGCEHRGEKLNEIRQAQEAARKAQVAVVVVGEATEMNGEGNDAASLDLLGMQDDLVKAVAATGTPTVVVLINGRPLSVRWIAENIPAVVEAWLPGEQGGHAVADVLFGDVNPSGKLSITVPRHVGQLPAFYNYKPAKAYWMARRKAYVDMPHTPLWEFGHGLSYTRFEFSRLTITPPSTGPAGRITVSATVRNTGSRDGAEVVQLYINDVVASVTRPVKELKGFRKVALRAGETRTVEFQLGPEELSMLDRQLKRVVEPGEFAVMVGASSEDIRLTGKFEVR
jgi:beta-glucosidase